VAGAAMEHQPLEDVIPLFGWILRKKDSAKCQRGYGEDFR